MRLSWNVSTWEEQMLSGSDVSKQEQFEISDLDTHELKQWKYIYHQHTDFSSLHSKEAKD